MTTETQEKCYQTPNCRYCKSSMSKLSSVEIFANVYDRVDRQIERERVEEKKKKKRREGDRLIEREIKALNSIKNGEPEIERKQEKEKEETNQKYFSFETGQETQQKRPSLSSPAASRTSYEILVGKWTFFIVYLRHLAIDKWYINSLYRAAA